MYRIRTGLLLATLTLTLGACSEQADEAVAAAPAPAPAPVAASEPLRNALLICIDTVRADTFFALGDLREDRLTQWQDSALVFTQAQSPAPWTVPALGSAFSGQWPVQHNAGSLAGVEYTSLGESRPRLMRKGVKTIAIAARQAGMTTNVVSASGWTFEAKNGVGINRGFDNFHKFVTGGLDEMGVVLWEPMLAKWRELISAQGDEERALTFLHLMDAHNWHMAYEPEIDARIATFSEEQLANYRATAPEPTCRDESSLICRRYLVYVHAIEVLRNAIADILDTLKENGQLKDTAVVLFSDHGEEFDDHIGDGRKPTKNRSYPFLGHGQSLYQEQLHVPLLVWHPDEQGRVVDTPVSLVDIAPSTANWLGLRFRSPDVQGRLLNRPASSEDAERVLYGSHVAEGEKQLAVRLGNTKSIWYVASDRTDIFDLVVDPAELHSAPTNALVMRFDRHFLEHEQMQQVDASVSAKFTDEQLKRLQSIGYLQGVENDEADPE